MYDDVAWHDRSQTICNLAYNAKVEPWEAKSARRSGTILANVFSLAYTMSVIITVILCLTAVVSVACQSAEPRGIQLRITQKGLDYSKYGLTFFKFFILSQSLI